MSIDLAMAGYAALASVFAVAYQLHEHVTSNDPVRWPVLAINVFMAALLGATTGGYLEERWPTGALFLVGMCGFWSWPVIAWIKKNWTRVAAKRLGIATDARITEAGKPDLSMYQTQDLATIVRRRRADKGDSRAESPAPETADREP